MCREQRQRRRDVARAECAAFSDKQREALQGAEKRDELSVRRLEFRDERIQGRECRRVAVVIGAVTKRGVSAAAMVLNKHCACLSWLRAIRVQKKPDASTRVKRPAERQERLPYTFTRGAGLQSCVDRAELKFCPTFPRRGTAR